MDGNSQFLLYCGVLNAEGSTQTLDDVVERVDVDLGVARRVHLGDGWVVEVLDHANVPYDDA